MLVAIQVLELQCDKCKKPYEDGEGMIIHFHDKEEYKSSQHMREIEEDWLLAGEMAYCEDCRKSVKNGIA